MKFTAFFIAACLQASAGGMAQTVSLSEQNISLKRLFKEINRQTGYEFLYSSKVLSTANSVSISVKDAPLNDVLAICFAAQPLTYTISGRTIVVRPLKVVEERALHEPLADRTVTGVVTDETSEALPGVSILLKGTQRGTVSDAEGRYSLEVPGEGEVVLVFSFVGYVSQEIAVGNSTRIDISLKPDEKALQEIVVVGYGEVKRSDLTGSAGSISGDELVKAPVKSFDEAFAGRIAGVQVTSNDGQPGAGMNIVIRGANSLNQDNSPLYVIDGFPIDGDINNSLNPSDIESIDVLKDASATAIYGARGANGVVIITTKRGKTGAPEITYDAYFGLQELMNRIELLSPYEFVRWQLERDYGAAEALYLTEGKTLESYRNEAPIDWQEKIFRVAPISNHNLSIRGGTEKGQYSVSGSALDQNGIVLNSGFKRYQGRFTLDQNINTKLKIGINTNYSDSKSYGTKIADGATHSDNFMYSVWAYRPVELSGSGGSTEFEEALFDDVINIGTDRRVNPVMQAKNQLKEQSVNSLFANAYAEYRIFDGLKFRSTFGVNRSTMRDELFDNSKTKSGSPLNPFSIGPNGSRDIRENINLSNENYLTFSKRFADAHNVNIVGVFSQQSAKRSLFGAKAFKTPNETLGISGLDEGTPLSINSSSSEWSLKSFLLRTNYDFKSKILVTASIRADGSSKFPEKNRWGYFPSGAVAYRFSDEAFMHGLDFISNAKIRASYGITGNNGVSDFARLSQMGFSYGYYYPFGNATPSVGAGLSVLGNTDLKWETTYQSDIGLDIELYNGRVSFVADYYQKNTRDLLLFSQLPSYIGYTNAFKNIGEVSNRGFELSITSHNLRSSKVNWQTSFNISFNRNEVVKLANDEESIVSTASGVFPNAPKYIAKVGYPIAQFYGVIYDGLYQLSDFNEMSNGSYSRKPGVPTNGTSTTIPGAIKMKDLNGDGTINILDYTIIGDPNPDFIGGLTNSLEYNGFDLSVFFQFSYGNQVLNANRITFEGDQGNLLSMNTNMYKTYSDRWSLENQSGEYPVFGSSIEKLTSRVIEDGSFLRLKTVSLGYTLPHKILSSLGLQSVRIYTSAQNLVTWTKYSGIDPDVSVRNSALTPAYDYSAYPRARTIVFGAAISF